MKKARHLIQNDKSGSVAVIAAVSAGLIALVGLGTIQLLSSIDTQEQLHAAVRSAALRGVNNYHNSEQGGYSDIARGVATATFLKNTTAISSLSDSITITDVETGCSPGTGPDGKAVVCQTPAEDTLTCPDSFAEHCVKITAKAVGWRLYC